MAFFGEFVPGKIAGRSSLQFSPAGKLNSVGHLQIFISGSITDILEKKGSVKKDQVQTIASMFIKHGEEFIRYLEGYFFIIIYDKVKETLFLFNNRYSNTTCYYLWNHDRLIFSDHTSALLEKLPERPGLNWDVINLFLNSGYSYSEKTYFEGINRMIPGFYLKVEKGEIRHNRYSEMQFRRKRPKDLDAALRTYEKIWVEELSKFTRANHTRSLASALSGGKDTSWVVYSASKSFPKKIQTYTCHYDVPLFNEVERAEYVTRRCGGIHHKILITEKDLDLLPETIEIAEEPILSSSFPIYKMMKEVSKKNDTILSGDGGNNIYHHLYPVGEIHKYVKNLPYLVRKAAFWLIDTLAKGTGNERLWELKYAFYPFSKSDAYDNFFRDLVCYRHFSQDQRKMLLKKDMYREFDENKMLGQIKIRKETFDDDLIASRFIYGNMQYVSTFQEAFARKLGIRYFPPYQNKRLMDFICTLPYDLLNKGNTFQLMTNKASKMHFHKLALKKHFPSSFVDKIGQPFDQPFHSFFERRPKVVELLFTRLKRRGWYNDTYLDQLLKEHKHQYQHKKIICQLSNHSYRIMALLSMELWCMRFLDSIRSKGGALEEHLKL
jgi:asparagine synthase (glutamine-hydrolysing)